MFLNSLRVNMFFIAYLPLLGKFQLTEQTAFNLLIASIRGYIVKESSYEYSPGSEVLTQPFAPKRKSRIDWQLAIWGFRSMC